MKKGLFIVLTALIVPVSMVACSDEEGQHSVKTVQVATTDTTDATAATQDRGNVRLKIILNTVNMRKSPNIGSPVIAKLPANTQVLWLGQVSTVTAPVKLRGVRYNDPWLYVATDTDKRGWIYAATAEVASTSNAAKILQQQLVKRRVKGFFGDGMVQAIDNYKVAYAQANTSEKFANMYTYGLGLRDKMVQVLQKKAHTDSENPADMRWLDKLLPGYTHARVAEGTAYYLFADYRQLAAKAKQTTGTEDDQLMDLYLTIFPSAKEGFFPAWIEQTWDYGGKSLLGSGIHKKVLDKLDALALSSELFTPILTSIKQQIIEDISNPKTQFSETLSKRKQEIQAILDAGYSILTEKDKQTLANVLKKMNK